MSTFVFLRKAERGLRRRLGATTEEEQRSFEEEETLQTVKFAPAYREKRMSTRPRDPLKNTDRSEEGEGEPMCGIVALRLDF